MYRLEQHTVGRSIIEAVLDADQAFPPMAASRLKFTSAPDCYRHPRLDRASDEAQVWSTPKPRTRRLLTSSPTTTTTCTPILPFFNTLSPPAPIHHDHRGYCEGNVSPVPMLSSCPCRCAIALCCCHLPRSRPDLIVISGTRHHHFFAAPFSTSPFR